MSYVSLLVFFFLGLFGLQYAEEERRPHPKCSGFACGKLGELKFPFTNTTLPSRCGVLVVDGCDKDTQKIQLERKGRWYIVSNISQANEIFIRDDVLSEQLDSRKCETIKNWSLPRSPYLSYQLKFNITMFNCAHKLSNVSLLKHACNDSSLYYSRKGQNLPSLPPHCSLLQLPLNPDGNYGDIFRLLTANFTLDVDISPGCWRCHYRGGDCHVNSNAKFYCANVKDGNNRLAMKVGLGLGATVAVAVIILLSCVVLRQYIRRHGSSNLKSPISSSGLSSKSEIELGVAYFGIPIFSYAELEKATRNFDSEKELGDGGYGTVYYGKLQDGREVAVKRLYEHNCKRVEQFLNEIKILTRLRHRNLVSLYGCTSRRSRELLLVYEYIPNGTVADHLHGDRADSSPLTWPIRMSIAIETAAALAYLHASDIIHRDVKTNNILLDNSFCVKVADFGLSRLFPNDVTHVSTAPQGTPGYVDPEYHQCYQLTDKSDVYSFGVVLIELISSMAAVDFSRHRDEINLANFAVNKVQKSAFEELIDPCFWYKSDDEVRRKAVAVGELAFRCLQQDKEMRPAMDEVLEELKIIEGGEGEGEHMEKEEEVTVPPPSPPDCVEESLLKNIRLPPSPDTVTAKWSSSCSTTPHISS
ncbi:LEAF RUST 10 DISEASE-RESISTANCEUS RECEPTOR-LIKE PROTEIN KINASE-like 1.1 isoform X4 [Euphorbia lathyris]|uniref:LEAF RUST 10 DISEASE-RESISTANCEUS RECEPTOR-LIKE PROTEIN KINASE-like 1.1 isoform X4 n=1 Tax=Euphorbia lathyris TaxID=212925 RepID=UPI003313BC34